MAFSFWSPPSLRPEQVNPMAGLISRAMKNFQESSNLATQIPTQQLKLQYLPKQLEAEIFSKKIGPLATLATSPMFLQNPQFQALLGNMISQNLGSEFGGGTGTKGTTEPGVRFPTYNEQNQQQFEKTAKEAEDLSGQGHAGTALSGAVSWLDSMIPGLGKHISEALTGGKITEEAFNQQKSFETDLNTLKRTAIQTGKISENDAQKEFIQKKGETPSATIKRIKKSFPYLYENETKKELTGKNNSKRKITQEEIHKTAIETGIGEDQVIELLAEKMGLSTERFMNEVYKQ